MRTTERLTEHAAALDALRAIAALAVVGLHLQALAGVFKNFPLLANLAPLGMFGVDLFYVLSGYFILGAVLRPDVWSPRAFLLQRVRRIVPAYYASIALVLVGLYGVRAGQADFFTPALVKDLFRHLSFTHNLSAESHGSLNGVYWTLGVEMSFYALMLLAAPVLRMRRALFWVIGGFVLCAWAWRTAVFLLVAPDPWLRFFWATQLPGALDSFAAGMLLAALQKHRPSVLLQFSGDRARVCLMLAVLAALGLLFANVFPLQELYLGAWPVVALWRSALALTFGALLLVFTLMPRSGWAERALRALGLPYLGKISYSLYLFHVPLILSALWASQHIPALGLRSILFAAVVATLLFSASASYYLIETPYLKVNGCGVKPLPRALVLASIVFALVGGAALRIQGLDRESLWSDELFSVGVAMHAGSPSAFPQHKTLHDLDIPDHFWTWKQADTAPPLYEILLAGWIKLVGGSDTAVRALSALFGLCLVALAGALPRGTPVLARSYFALGAAFNSALVTYSQEARAYSMACFLAGLMTVLFLRDLSRALRDQSHLSPSSGQFVAMASAVMTHYYLLPYCGLLAVIYGIASARAGRRLRAGLLGLPFLPVALYLIWGIDGVLFKLGSPVSGEKTVVVSLLRSLKEIGRMLTPGFGSWMWLMVLAFPWALWQVGHSLVRGIPAQRAPAVAWLVALAVPFVVLLGLATRGMEFFHPRYLLFVLPVVLLVLSYAAGCARSGWQGLCALVCASILIVGCLDWFQRPLPSKDQYREAAAFIAAHFSPGDRVIGIWRANKIMYAHYLVPELGADYGSYLEGVASAEEIEATSAVQVLPGQKVFLFDHVYLRGMTDAVRERMLARGFRDVARQQYFRTGVVVLMR